MIGTIAVPLDGSDFSTGALPAAPTIAHAAGAALRLVGVARSDEALAWLRLHVEEAARAVTAVPPEVDIVIDADPAAALLRIADEPGTVLCFASHDHGPVPTALLHSVGSTVMAHATRPFIVVRPSADGETTPPVANDVVVVVDGVDDPGPLLPVGIAWAEQLQAPLRLVTVYEPVPADIRHPDHFTRHHGPPGDPGAYMAEVGRRVEASGATVVGVAAVPDATSVADGLARHLHDRPARLLVFPGADAGVLRRLLRELAVPILVAPLPKGRSTMAVSDQLTTLAARTKLLEDRAAAAQSKAKSTLEQDVKAARESAQEQAEGLRQRAEISKDLLSSQWDGIQRSWNEHLAGIRQDIDDKRAAHDHKKAQRIAEEADADAAYALDFAYGAVEEAEYAVLDAILARMEADEPQ